MTGRPAVLATRADLAHVGGEQRPEDDLRPGADDRLAGLRRAVRRAVVVDDHHRHVVHAGFFDGELRRVAHRDADAARLAVLGQRQDQADPHRPRADRLADRRPGERLRLDVRHRRGADVRRGTGRKPQSARGAAGQREQRATGKRARRPGEPALRCARGACRHGNLPRPGPEKPSRIARTRRHSSAFAGVARRPRPAATFRADCGIFSPGCYGRPARRTRFENDDDDASPAADADAAAARLLGAGRPRRGRRARARPLCRGDADRQSRRRLAARARRLWRRPTRSSPRTRASPAACSTATTSPRRSSPTTSTTPPKSARASSPASPPAKRWRWSPTPARRSSPTPATSWWSRRRRRASRSSPCPARARRSRR